MFQMWIRSYKNFKKFQKISSVKDHLKKKKICDPVIVDMDREECLKILFVFAEFQNTNLNLLLYNYYTTIIQL
jgi:hypothetical protein